MDAGLYLKPVIDARVGSSPGWESSREKVPSVRWDFVEHRDVRLDPAIMHEPVQHLDRAIGAAADQALGYRSKCSNERSIMRFAAKISA